ncbi:MAG TPA: alkaline phosphatase family protein [Thermoplasmata archaeon]|nr:alkaline phosphatase family protein [Thermoplasmata archaeon]
MTGTAKRRLLVIGLDSASPEYLFGRCLPVMPNLARLLKRSTRAPLLTTDPPISLPAWAVMFTGVDPGTLGMYGFRHRLNHSYTQNYGPASDRLPVPTLWETLSRRGRRVGLIAMPPAYPPPHLNGFSVSDFLTPEGANDWTFPPSLAEEIRRRWPNYRFDVTFRATEREQLYRDIVTMTEERFSFAEEMYQRERWDAFAVHEVGTDRLHHAYTKYFDPQHASYVAGNPFEFVLDDYYRVVDRCLGRLLALIDEQTVVAITSDHGSMPMAGCFCINQWLAERGYLAVTGADKPGTPLEKATVDWSRTRVWGAGGYYARLFFNLKGRESEGIVDPLEVPQLRASLVEQLGQLRLPTGAPLVTGVLDPHSIYRQVAGDPPDLMIYFDDLRWRSAGSLGHPTLFLKENDTGPDDAVHSREGVFVLADPARPVEQVLPPQHILDVTPTLLAALGEELPTHLQGRPIAVSTASPAAPVPQPARR